ncbi:hypothetical protein SAMN05428939_7770 [Streptomyces sp. TLI_105]|nr:hypothetical protein SAMN05428939_7770 [Streptomyces sp. TLI_105]
MTRTTHNRPPGQPPYGVKGDVGANNTLAVFLGALAAWVDDSPGWYRNFGKEIPAGGDRAFIARALQAAKVYE